jgi:diguanylate cyclase (GGDEF)-like protein/PAS domain S-box-containing protein
VEILKKNWLESLRVRLILLICVSSTPPLAVLIYHSFHEQQRIESDALDRTFRFAQLASQYQGGLIQGTEEFLHGLSKTSVVTSRKLTECQKLFTAVLAKNKRYSNIGVANLNGEIVCSGAPLLKQLYINDRLYFKKAVETKKFSIGEYHVGRVTGTPSIGMAVPILNLNDQVQGVVYAAIDLATLKNTTDEIALPPGAILMMFDHKGKTLVKLGVDSKSEWIVDHARSELTDLDSEIGSTEIYKSNNGMPWIFSFAGVRGLEDRFSLSVVIATPMESIIAESKKAQLITFVLMFLSSLLVFSAAFFGTQAFILRRINALIKATKLIGQGDFDIEVKKQVGAGELGELASQFDQMAAQIKKSLLIEQEYRYLFERNPNPMWILSLPNLNFSAVNDAALNHYGYSRGEFLNMSVFDILPIDEKTRAVKFTNQFPTSSLTSSKWRHLLKSGDEIQVEVSTYPIVFQGKPSVFASIKDVTNQWIAETRLAEQNQHIQIMMDSTAEAICGVNSQGVCIFGNPSLAKILGYQNVNELIGKNISDIARHEDSDGNNASNTSYPIIMAIKNGEKLQSDKSYFLRKDDSVIPVEFWTHPILKEGLVTGSVITFFDITERRTHQDALEFQAGHDSLTSLPNRRILHQKLSTMIASDQSTFMLMLIDLDRFKEVNDSLGHQAGDNLLKLLAERLNTWADDISFVCRLGGDEFAITISDVSDNDDAKLLAQNVVDLIKQPFDISGIRIQVGASVGIARYPTHGSTSIELLRCADVAMYAAKSNGSMKEVYDAAKDAHSAEHLSLMSDLHVAIEENQLILHFQPKVNLQTSHVIGFEALIRWQHPLRGLIPPNEFIPGIELTSLIRPFTQWVIDNALAECKKWHENGSNATVAVNVSTRNLLDLELPNQISELLSKYNLPAHFLELEITESAIMADPVRSMEVLQEIRSQGVLISIDDFGTGYSSLEYLQKLPITSIKIDQSFIKQMNVDDGVASIVNSVINLAHSLKLEVVAEGVEDEITLKTLTQYGCDIAQGYFISRPMPNDQVKTWLKKFISPMKV